MEAKGRWNARKRLELLAEAGKLLETSLDYEATLRALAGLLVPRLADWYSVELLDESTGKLRNVSVTHFDPEKTAFAKDLQERFPPRPEDPTGPYHVLRTGQPDLLEEIPDALLAESVSDPEQLEIVRALGLKSAIVLPLIARGRALGALTLVQAESGRRFGPSDVDLVMQIASRAALAVDTAELFRAALQAEERLSFALDAGQLGAWEWDVETGKTRVSPWLERIHGYAPGTMHPAVSSIGAGIHPEDLEAFRKGIDGAIAQRKPFRLVYRVIRPDGELRWVEANGKPVLDGADIPRRLVGVCADITERKHAEEVGRALVREQTEHRLAVESAQRIGRILDSIADPFLALDAEGHITFFNRACETLFGVTKKEAIGVHVRNVASLPGTSGLTDKVLEAQKARVPEVFEWFFENQEVCFQIHLYPFEKGLSLYARDITERKRAENALSHHAAELARSNAELERFAYVASHDLQEPLRMVGSYTQLLARRYQGKLGQDADDFIHYAVDGVTRMQQLINDLLTFSRVGTRSEPSKPVPMEAALDHALRNLEVTLEETDAEIIRHPLPTVMGDPSQITQLFQNLIGNALKFRNGRPRIEISAERKNGMWELAVQDNGIGIDPKYFDRIFLIFQRLHPKGAYPGTGIGLAICQKIVERHGGRIWAESAPGRGARFSFTLPEVREHDLHAAELH